MPDSIYQKLELYKKILTTENCLLIYFYLLIYGRSDPSTLIEKLDIGKTTLYRNLDLLHAVNTIERIDNEVEDRRKTSLYQISSPFTDFKDMTEAIAGLENSEVKKKVKQEWDQIFLRTPTIFSDITSKLFMLVQTHDMKVADSVNHLESEHSLKLAFFSIYDHSKIPEIADEIQKLLKMINSKKDLISQKVNMKAPTSLLINYVRFQP